MAINAYGYDGEIPEQVWANMAPMLGDEWTFSGTGPSSPDMKPTIATGDRTVQVAAGWAMSHGVAVQNTAAVTVQCPAITSGSRWDTVAIRRDWTPAAGGTAAIVVVTGTAAQALAAGLQRAYGVVEDQPIALAQVAAGKSQVQSLIDLRSWGTKTISAASTLAVPTPADGMVASIGGVLRQYRATTGAWTQVGSPIYYQAACVAQNTGAGAGHVLATLNIPYPGYPYRVETWARVVGTTDAGVRGDFNLYVDGDAVGWTFLDNATRQEMHNTAPGYSEIKYAASKVEIRCTRFAGTGYVRPTTYSRLYAKVVPT